MPFIDSAAQDSWEFVAEIGFFVVIVGVALEIIDLVAKRRKHHREESILVKDPMWLWWVECASVILVVLGLAVEFIAGINATLIGRQNSDKLRTQARAAFDRAGIAEIVAGQANERAAIIESNSFALSLRVEELRKENNELSLSVKPPVLPEDKLSSSIDLMRKYAGTTVAIVELENSPQSTQFAAVLTRWMTVWLWKPAYGGTSGTAGTPLPTGVTVLSSISNEGVSKAFADFLKSCNVQVTLTSRLPFPVVPEVEASQLIIFIGARK